MEFKLNTSLYLRTSPATSNELINLDLVLDRSSSSSSSPSSPMSPCEPRMFTCTYCKRKFYSSQALGGHQNAHKLERTLAKKSREQLSSGVKSQHSSPTARHLHPVQQWGSQGRQGRFFSDHDHVFGYGRREELVRHGSSDEEIDHLDLSLRL